MVFKEASTLAPVNITPGVASETNLVGESFHGRLHLIQQTRGVTLYPRPVCHFIAAVCFFVFLFLINCSFGAIFLPTADELKDSVLQKGSTTSLPVDFNLSKFPRQVYGEKSYVVVDDMLFEDSAIQPNGAVSGNLWPSGNVYYVFDPAVSNSNRVAWTDAAAAWSAVASVRFFEGTGDGNYIYVQNSAENSSAVGMSGTGKQYMNIVSWGSRYIIAHEIGHALGLIHEQSRSDRDSYVVIFPANIQAGQQHNFDIWPNAMTIYGAYDFDSLMHYARMDFSQNGQDTIEPVSSYSSYLNTMGQRDHLSPLDQNAMAQRYGSPGGGQTQDLFAPNGGFENNLAGWTMGGTSGSYGLSTQFPHSGTYYAVLCNNIDNAGSVLDHVYVTIPASATSVKLGFWLNVVTQETTVGPYDRLVINVIDSSGAAHGVGLYSEADKGSNTDGAYALKSIDLTSYKGQSVQIEFFGSTDGHLHTIFRIDDVSLTATLPNPPPTPTPTATATATATPRPTATATATATPTATATATPTATATATPRPTATATATATATVTPSPTCVPGWSAGGAFPAVAVARAVGNYFPANGRFYVLGGRSAETAGNEFSHPFEYDPAVNAWITKAATLPDNQVNNMACGVLTVGSSPQIYCVGGSAYSAGSGSATARVFSYNPVTDTVTTLSGADNWPGNPTGTILPGGFSVVANKLYIFGGFQLSTNMTAQTWQFDPNAAAGSRWVRRADYPLARGYIPAATIGGFIYTAGGSTTDGNILTDTADSFRYDPVGDVWTSIANIPRATAETRAVAINSQMWVLGGGRTASNPSSEVDSYNPRTNSWTAITSFAAVRRNFPADSDGGSGIWLAGGYDAAGTVLNTMELYRSCAPVQLGNISTRLSVGTGDNALIGGFIITGTQPKKVIVRGIGPSLSVPGKLANPTLQLFQGNVLLDSNDDWQQSPNKQAIIDSGVPPTNNFESAIVATLPANNSGYTAILRGVNNGTGIGVVEAYDLDQTVDSKLANISTRGFVGTGDNVLIGGTIITGNSSTKTLFRAIGPSLSSAGVGNALQDPTLEIHDGNGILIISNDNWRSYQEAAITATGIPPADNRESAILLSLAPGAYTAIVRGNNNSTGVAVVEAYQLP